MWNDLAIDGRVLALALEAYGNAVAYLKLPDIEETLSEASSRGSARTRSLRFRVCVYRMEAWPSHTTRDAHRTPLALLLFIPHAKPVPRSRRPTNPSRHREEKITTNESARMFVRRSPIRCPLLRW
jgi:hypothetical protein